MKPITTGQAGPTVERQGPVAPATPAPSPSRTRAQRGQMLVLFVMSIFVITGLVGIVIDVSWYWSNSLRVQRAADAAALAGAVDLPSKPGTTSSHPLGTGIGDAMAQAGKNGYVGLTLGCKTDTVTPTVVPGICAHQDAGNRNQMNVTVSAPVGTFFMRIFGIPSITATRSSKALFTLPVPMGSPENYYGNFGAVRNATFTGTTTTDTGFDPPAAVDTTVTWTSPASINNKATPDGTTFTTSTTTSGSQQSWRQWSFGIPSGATIIGIEAQLNAKLAATDPATNCTIGVQLSPNGSQWYPSSPALTTGLSNTETMYPLGSAANTTLWAGHTWVQGDFSSNASTGFHARLTWVRGGCANTEKVMVDTFTVKVTYSVTTTTTGTRTLSGPGAACLNGSAGCYQDTGGQVLNPRGFWATMNTAGAANVNGDAYQPYYDVAGSTPSQTCPSAGNACYDPVNYYNYAVYMPPNTSGGYVYVYDPVFCATALASGTGDRWFGSSNPVSSWYELFADPNNTPYDITDDTLVATSGSKFQDIAASDTSMGGSGGSQCRQTNVPYGDGRDYHDSWYLLNPGNPLTGDADGTTYRIHTTSSVPTGQTDSVNQRGTDGEQSFAIFANNAEGTTTNGRLPQVYGLGAMQMFTPLSAAGSTTNSEFYLAQVPAYYAGKILEIRLWDPGDTSPLSATLYIEVPTSSGWQKTPFTYSATVGTSNGNANSTCTSRSSSSPSNNSVQTSTGASLGLFNGCWLTLEIPIPTSYAGDQNGWWKILYSMNGNGTSSDVTTWTASIKGNPVHLVVP